MKGLCQPCRKCGRRAAVRRGLCVECARRAERKAIYGSEANAQAEDLMYRLFGGGK